jgi:hypothetical protein
MGRDAAGYFFTHAERVSAVEHPDKALRYYRWSKKLYLHCEILGEKARKVLKTIDEGTAAIEANQQHANSEVGYDAVAEPCS